MKTLRHFWSGLEAISGLSAVAVEWQEVWGPEWEVGQAFLRPSDRLATSYPCPHPGGDGCPRGVVRHSEQDIVAVCRTVPKRCDDLTLAKADIVVYELDWWKLTAAVGRAFGFTMPRRPVVVSPQTIRVGWRGISAGKRAAVYLTIQRESQGLESVLSHLLSDPAPPFVFAAPTREFCERDRAELLRNTGVLFLPLDECLTWEEPGEFAPTEEARSLLSEFAAASGAPVTRRRAKRTQLKPIAVPPNSRWDELHLVVDDLELRYVIGVTRGRRGFAEAGFEDQRRGKLPNDSWQLLRKFARHGSRPFEMGADEGGRQAAKQKVSKLRERLKRLFGIAGDPIENVAAGTYAAVFRVRTQDGFALEFPANTSWSAVSITETRTGRIRFTVDTKERYLVYSDGQATEGPREREGAERSVPVSQEHDLWLLGFLDEDGQPTRVGHLLLEVLRAGEPIRREPDDSDMLKLCGVLCHMTGIEAPPFRFERSRETWSAEFEASSEHAAR